jgi:DNA-binding PadR family transcriptional regulator
MSLHDVVLSLLREPMSGTDLARLFDSTISHFWSVDLSQIYRALDRLEEDGAVRSRSMPSSRGPARRVFRLTAAGKRRLEAWISGPPRVPVAKFEYLAQLFSVTADSEPQERARELLHGMRGEAAAAVAALTELDGAFRGFDGYPDRMPAAIFYPWLTLRHGLRRRQAFLEWIDECLEILDRRPRGADAEEEQNAIVHLARMIQSLDQETEEAPALAGQGEKP